MVAAKVANMKQGERTDIQPSADLRKVISQDQAASMLNIGKRSVQRVTARDGCGENCEYEDGDNQYSGGSLNSDTHISAKKAAGMLNIGKRSVQRVTARDGCGENCEYDQE
jgi:uncharacterized metal-binding protein